MDPYSTKYTLQQNTSKKKYENFFYVNAYPIPAQCCISFRNRSLDLLRMISFYMKFHARLKWVNKNKIFGVNTAKVIQKPLRDKALKISLDLSNELLCTSNFQTHKRFLQIVVSYEVFCKNIWMNAEVKDWV